MQVPTIFAEKRNMIIEIVVLCLFLGAMYYGYTIFSEKSPTTTASTNEQLFGPNLTILLKAVNQDNLVLKDVSFMNSELVRQLQDFSEIITQNATRGREDPFIPYR